jgi:hypothetical protein
MLMGDSPFAVLFGAGRVAGEEVSLRMESPSVFQEYGRKEAVGCGINRETLHPPSFTPSSLLTPLDGCQKHHDQDGGWDLKQIMDLIMEICGISSFIPQPLEATPCPDEHMCEDKDICPQH